MDNKNRRVAFIGAGIKWHELREKEGKYQLTMCGRELDFHPWYGDARTEFLGSVETRVFSQCKICARKVIKISAQKRIDSLCPNKPICYGGWIAPNGKLYSCPYEAHIQLASDLVKNIYSKNPRNPEKYLEDNGWIKVDYKGEIFHWLYRDTVTQPQIDTLGDLLACEYKESELILKSPYHGGRYMRATESQWRRNIQAAIYYLMDGKNE
jgi:hypothetical protein